MRIWLGHLADLTALRRLIELGRAEAAEYAHEAELGAARSDEVPAWRYPAVVNRWAARYYRAQVALADELLAELDAEAIVEASE